MTYRLETSFVNDNPRITIVGCGGTGGFVAEAICRLFTGREASIALVDHDVVEPHNLLRQNFHPGDVGRHKSRVLADRLSQTYSRTIGYSTEAFQQDSSGMDFPAESHRPTLLLGCVDNAEARREMERYLVQRRRTWIIDAGNGINWGQVLVGCQTRRQYRDSLDWQNRKCFQPDGRCLWLPSPATQRPDILTAIPETPPDVDCAAALDLVDQDPVINQTMAMMVVHVIRRMAAGDCPYMSLYVDLGLGTMTPRYATPENVAQVLREKPENMVSDGNETEGPIGYMGGEDYGYGDDDDDEDEEE